MSKRILSFLLSVVLLLSLTACGGGGSTAKEDGGKVDENEATADILESIPNELKGSTIKYFMWYDGTKETEGPVMKAFELEGGIKVEVEVGSNSTFQTELAAKIATNQSPDVVRMYDSGISNIKLLQPLENTGYDFSGSEWDQRLMKDYTVNGKCYGTNLKNTVYFDANVLWYNSQTLMDLGVEDPYTSWKKGEWTWDALWDICRDFVNQGGSYGACLNPVNAISLAYGVNFIDWDGEKYVNSVADPDRKAKLITAWTDSITKKQEKLITNNTWLISDFEAGRSAFFSTSISAGFVKRSYFERFKEMGELRCVPFPASYTGDNMILMSEYSAWGIPQGASNKEAVPYFLKYMLNADNYDLESSFADPTITDVFKTLRDSDVPRYNPVFDHTLVEADSGLNKFQMFDKLYNGEVSQINSTLGTFIGGLQDSVDKANEQLKTIG